MAQSKNYYSNMASANSPIPSGGQPPIATGGGANFDIIQWLQQAVQQLNTPQSGGNSQGGMAVSQQRMGGGGQPQKQQISQQNQQNQDPIQMLTSLLSMSNQQQPMQSAYTKGVDKALKESGYSQAMEALTQGVDPMHISSEANRMGMMLGQQTAMQQPLLQNLLAMAQQPQQQMQQQMTPIQQQAMEQVSTPKSGIGKIFDALGFAEPVRQQKLNTLSKAQEIMGEQPIQPKDRLTQEVEVVKAIATNNATMYQNIISQENKINDQYVKDFEPLKIATDSVSKITELYQDSLVNPNNNVNDFFLVYNAIKAADPNAVKEGEYKTVQELMPLASKILNGINFKLKGETLTPDQRSRIVKAAVTQYNGLSKRFEPLSKQYEQKIRSYGGSPKRTLVNYGAQGKENISGLEKELKKRGLI